MGLLFDRLTVLLMATGVICNLLEAYKNYESAARDKAERLYNKRKEEFDECEQKRSSNKQRDGWLLEPTANKEAENNGI